MKYLTTLFATLAFSSLVSASTIVVDAPLEHLFIPKGFDNNDNIEVVVSGNFPSACYARNKVEVKVTDLIIYIKVTALFNDNRDYACEKIEVPFTESVTIGTLQAATYDVMVNGALKEKLTVTESSSEAVDDFLYAQVDYVELGFTGGVNGDIFLVGRTQDCLALDRIETISNGKDTLSVLPIMKKVSENCTGARVHFSFPVNFEIQSYNYEKTLIFVRTLDGKSVHSMIERN